MDDDNDLARRQAALRALAQNQQPAPTPQRKASAPAPVAKVAKVAKPSAIAEQVTGRRANGGKRRGVIASLAALVVVVLVGGAVGAHTLLARRAATPAAKPVIRVTALGDGLGCITAVVWSPNGKQIAAQGDLNGECGGSTSDSQTGAIFIYDAASGQRVGQLHPDTAIFSAPAVEHFVAANTTPLAPPAALNYQSLTWTPDGRALLMVFNVSTQVPEGQNGVQAGLAGVLRLGVSQSSLTALWTDTTNVLYVQPNSIERWDLTTGKSALVPAPTVATRYRWNSDGTLSPDGSAAGKPIGAPNSGQTFSIWQSGGLQFAFGQQTSNSMPDIVAKDIQWAASVTPVSPDGRYFYPYFPAFGSLVPPSTAHAYPNEQTVEPHDPALVALANQFELTPPNQNGEGGRVLVTWRPDGRLLAEITSNDGSGATTTFTVSIYDTQTGKLVKRLTPNFTGLETGAAGAETLAWSPDGSRLLLADNVYGAITVWGPGALPA